MQSTVAAIPSHPALFLFRVDRRRAPARPSRNIAALAGSGSGDIGGKGGSFGGSGGGGSGDGKGKPEDNNEGNKPQKGGLFKGWEDRVAYDPEFPVKVGKQGTGRYLPLPGPP